MNQLSPKQVLYHHCALSSSKNNEIVRPVDSLPSLLPTDSLTVMPATTQSTAVQIVPIGTIQAGGTTKSVRAEVQL